MIKDLGQPYIKMWGVLSCFLGPFVCLLMNQCSQKAKARESTDEREYARLVSPENSPEGLDREDDGSGDGSGVWTFEDNKRFENALAMLTGPIDAPSLRDFVEQIAPGFPGKSVEQVWRHLEALWHDVDLIESGEVMFPEQWMMEEEGEHEHEGSDGGGPSSKGKSKVQRRRGIAWTKEEHEQFLAGLEIYGKGDWKSISRQVVLTKTPTQVASHAQKYFNRKDRTEKQKFRRSINDTHSISHIGSPASPSARYMDGE